MFCAGKRVRLDTRRGQWNDHRPDSALLTDVSQQRRWSMSSSLGTALASGRSPAYWLREMVQHATWTDTFRYTCAWLPELIALQPVLNNGPLFARPLPFMATDRSQPTPAS